MKRNRRELSLSVTKYMIHGDSYLLNDKQKEVVEPYIKLFKIGYKIAVTKLAIAKCIEKLDKCIVNFAGFVDDTYSSFYNKTWKYLNSDPRFVQKRFNKFIAEVEKHEDSEGSSKYEQLINETRRSRILK